MSSAAVWAGRRVAVLVAMVWAAVYVTAAWPHLGGPLPVTVLLTYGALPTPLSPEQWPRVFTTWLLHIDPLHLMGNLAAWSAAWLPGPALRHRSAFYRLAVFIGCGLGASLTVLLGYGRQPTISVGPSGALLGLLVALLLQRGVLAWVRAVWLLVGIALLVGGALTGGDTAAHLGGAVTGLGLGLLVRARDTSRA
jgi:membrane associated rhomboid family serine protease